MALATQAMRNNLHNSNYFMMSAYSCAVHVFCSKIPHVFQLLELCYAPAPASPVAEL